MPVVGIVCLEVYGCHAAFYLESAEFSVPCCEILRPPVAVPNLSVLHARVSLAKQTGLTSEGQHRYIYNTLTFQQKECIHQSYQY